MNINELAVINSTTSSLECLSTGRLVDDSNKGSALFEKVTNKEGTNIIHRAYEVGYSNPGG